MIFQRCGENERSVYMLAYQKHSNVLRYWKFEKNICRKKLKLLTRKGLHQWFLQQNAENKRFQMHLVCGAFLKVFNYRGKQEFCVKNLNFSASWKILVKWNEIAPKTTLGHIFAEKISILQKRYVQKKSSSLDFVFK